VDVSELDDGSIYIPLEGALPHLGDVSLEEARLAVLGHSRKDHGEARFALVHLRSHGWTVQACSFVLLLIAVCVCDCCCAGGAEALWRAGRLRERLRRSDTALRHGLGGRHGSRVRPGRLAARWHHGLLGSGLSPRGVLRGPGFRVSGVRDRASR